MKKEEIDLTDIRNEILYIDSIWRYVKEQTSCLDIGDNNNVK